MSIQPQTEPIDLPKHRLRNAYQVCLKAADLIEQNPDHYDQNSWCGTAFCRAGWIAALVNKGVAPKNSEYIAREVLGAYRPNVSTTMLDDIGRLFQAVDSSEVLDAEFGAVELYRFAYRWKRYLRSVQVRVTPLRKLAIPYTGDSW